MTERRIYVACLASYNAGILHGEWIDTEGMDADELSEEVRDKVLLTSPCPNVVVDCPDCEGEGQVYSEEQFEQYMVKVLVACDRCHGKGKLRSAEEYAIHDHEGFPDGAVGEYTPLSEIAAFEEKLGELRDGEVDAFYAFLSAFSINLGDADIERFREAYYGYHKSGEDFAEEYAEDCGDLTKDCWLLNYIDWERVWRDMDFVIEDGHVFRSDW
jgi:antirestriction protein